MNVNAQRMPDLTLTDRTGRVARLSDHLAADNTVLYFLRSPTCPVCIGHARKLAAACAQGRLPAPVVLVAPGDAQAAATVARRIQWDNHRIPHESGVAVTAGNDAHTLVGLPRQMLMQHSGTFMVGPDRQIRYARTALMPTGSFDERALLAALNRSRTATA